MLMNLTIFLPNYWRVKDRKIKNTLNNGGVYQINTAVMPRWELAMGRRGLVQIEDGLANVIFDLEQNDNYDMAVKSKLRQYNAPFTAETMQELQFGEDKWTILIFISND